MVNKHILFLGGTGGLGTKLIPYMDVYDVEAIGSNILNLNDTAAIKTFFKDRFLKKDKLENLIIFSNVNYNGFLHKYNDDSYSYLIEQLDVNIKGITTVIIEALKIMRLQNYGKIIIASSVVVDKPVRGTGIYSSSKAFFENLVKTIALENGSKNITANCLQLGYMDGGLLYSLPDEFLTYIQKEIPIGRFGTIEEIYSAIQFILNNDYINGTTIKLTAGL